MGLLKNLNFPRVLIMACLVASVYLGWRGWNERVRINELEAALVEGGEVEELVREAQSLSKQYTSLAKQLSTEKMGPQESPLEYIQSVVSKDNIELGQVDTKPSTKQLGNGLVDANYRITPQDKSETFDKVQIANFLYTLEFNSHRVRVTDIKIGTPDRIEPHEYPPDLWTLDCTITSRQKAE